ncbi:serine hydrolase [Bacillus solimangrovi]|uniref:Beta-lactamase class A catalytic domain-containing protein n=1 Tax=Bacillus solimangrovi TaxID=1305675 RepID=A0A1E5LI38_9BACI|nr:serine hydrolase [Bacillus solimangrovi]OEH93754.1 hypothetical protein BFG57_11250 [Bacillus solimangrovi]
MILLEHIKSMIPANIELGLYIYDTKTEEVTMLNESEPFPLASLAKFIASVFAMTKADSVADIQRAISHHDSQSYEQLLNNISTEQQNKKLAEMDIELKVDHNNRSLTDNVGTAEAMFKFLYELYTRALLNDEQTSIIFEALNKQVDPDGFRMCGQWLHMTGGLEGVCNDIGYWQLEDRTIILVGFIKSLDDGIQWQQLENLLMKIGDVVQSTYQLKD